MKNVLFVGIVLLMAGCANNMDSAYTAVKAKEVEQVGSYTYLLVKGKGPEYWVAGPSMEAMVGETYYYQGGMWMENFHSKELDRTFDKVLFLDAIYSVDPGQIQAQGNMETPASHSMMGGDDASFGNKKPLEKLDVKVESVEGTVSIADLFAEPGAYEGKKIRVAGEVTKYNAAIMELNWVHIQDGTEHEGKFDLTATSVEQFQVGSKVVLEGILALDKDFGYGYSYDLLLEQTTAVQ